MLKIECPWCGPREQIEFSCQGEAHIVRPVEPEKLSDEDWGNYIFFRKNPKGVHFERWIHSHGCRRWFNAVRHTISDEFLCTYKPGDSLPAVPESFAKTGVVSVKGVVKSAKKATAKKAVTKKAIAKKSKAKKVTTKKGAKK
jgi:heterotetrameric sarcosine oxidase delta subunit